MLYLGADHRGFILKEHLKKYLHTKKIPFVDLGNSILDQEDDFVDFAAKVGEKVAENKTNRGILICGLGVGVCIAANKIKGIRAGQVFSKEMAMHARKDDDINIVALSADTLREKAAQNIIDVFLTTKFRKEERFIRRLNKIKTLELKW
jgi:ribose 5-phosphate isomerase B